MIIDCHGHYTTAPAAHEAWRSRQIKSLDGGPAPGDYPTITDDEIRVSLEAGQLRIQKERGIDLTLFSPKASAMAHHIGDRAVSETWTRHCNDLIARVVRLFPKNFVGVAQLPQSRSVDPAACIAEVERCVLELGFVGVNLNPDPSGGFWTEPRLTDRSFYPLWEKLVALDVPAMIHVSGSCNANHHTTGGHYINGDTTAFMQLLEADLFRDFPGLKLIIPHGGGAAPYHWGRYRGLAQKLGKPLLDQHLMQNLYFDTCVYHQPGIDLLTRVIPSKNILFATEMLGAVDGIDPTTGFAYDDTGRYLQGADLAQDELGAIFQHNALKVYGRLEAQMRRQGILLA